MDDSSSSQSILVVDDTPIVSQYLKQQLAVDDIRVHFADTPEAAHALLKEAVAAKERLELLILGSEILLSAGDQTIASLRKQRPQCPWISLIDCNSDATDLQAILSSRLHDQPAAIIATDKQQVLLGQVKKVLAQARSEAQITILNEKLQAIQKRFEQLLDTSTEAIAFVVSGCHVYANPSFLQLTGIADLQQLERHSLLELLVSNDPSTPLKSRLHALESHDIDHCEIECQLHIDAGAQALPVIARLHRASYAGEDCIQVSVSEKPVITAAATGEQLLGYLPKQVFVDLSTQALADKPDNGQAHAVLCVRLDNHAQTQEQIGLLASESLIEERAALLRTCIDEEHDLMTHYNESLFLVTVGRAQRSAIEQLCQHIVSTFSAQLAEIGQHSLSATCSIGFAMSGRQINDVNTLILNAARAAREAEQSGGNRSLRYRPVLHSVDEDDNRGQWQERLRHALDNNELVLATTRVSDIGDESRGLVSVDLCFRDSSSDTIVYSDAWGSAIQGSGLRAELDRQLIRLTMQKPELLKQTVFVPIAASEHDAKVLADWLRASLKHVDSQGDSFVFLLDSTDLVNNMQPAVMLQRALQSTSVQWGLDMFGATENAAQLLQHLRTSYVRLCASVLPKEHGNASEAEQLSQLAAAGNNADTEIIACSVDNAAIVPTLWQCGIKLIQGEFIQQYPEVLEA
ncbi:MAG: EAL domain-containing protein [Gammaproteobacteria bacterium]|jgi:EAL domain-containing protein (putative c-di-GMP-specific phosphodiesterase class I)/GGDEF domain-containing protein/DNA-binding NarL/FixJ family response regulator|nr:EAL domain-containing protein [Gammaproteobacteria bacterium]